MGRRIVCEIRKGAKLHLVHQHSGAVMQVKFVRYSGEDGFIINWPLYLDDLRFTATGYGRGAAKQWRIRLDDLRRLRGDKKYKPPAPKPPRVVARKPRRGRAVDPRQLRLFADEPTRAAA
jgi:hypothetical protein